MAKHCWLLSYSLDEEKRPLSTPFPRKHLVIIGLEYVNENNGLPKIELESLSPGEYAMVSGDNVMQLSDGGGGLSFFILLQSVS